MSENVLPDESIKVANLALWKNKKVIYITQSDQPQWVLMGYKQYEQLMTRLEELSDLMSLEETADEPTRPYSEFLAELGVFMEDTDVYLRNGY